jgi:predicted nucleic acid-binding protein
MILLDSSLIVAYSNEADENHTKALRVMEDIDRGRYGSPIITDFVFDEVMTVMLFKTKDLSRTAELGETLLSANLLFKVDGELFNLAWKTFKEQRGPNLSFTDCTSIAVCRENGIPNIATFDEDFRRFGQLRVVGVQSD